MRTALAGVVLLVMLVCMTTEVQAAEYPVNYVLGNGAALANKAVTVRGVTANSQAVTPTPLSDIRGEYDLTDKSGTIHVRTTQDPPPNGIARTVNAVVDGTGTVPILNETGGMAGGIPLWALVGVLAALVVLAVVLVLLLVRKPSSAAVGDRSKANVGPPIVGPTINAPNEASRMPSAAAKQCPKCGRRYGPEDSYCEDCPSQALEPAKASVRERTPSVPTAEVQKATDGATREVSAVAEARPLADLTVIEGPGARRGTQFRLSQEKQTIGRAEGVQIRLSGDDTISRPHATIGWDNGTFYIADLDSRAGTLVNGQKVHRQALSDGDTIRLGETELKFRLISQSAGVPK